MERAEKLLLLLERTAITYHEAFVLMSIRHGNNRPTMIAKHTMCQMTNLTRWLKNLEQYKYITRRIGKDRRQLLVDFTDKGAALAEELHCALS